MSNNPSEDYLLRDKERIENRMSLLQQAFEAWRESLGIKDVNAAQSQYDKLNDVATLKRHLSNIHYILTN